MSEATNLPPRPEGVSAREPIDEVVELLSMTFLYEQGRFLTVLGKMILWFVLVVIFATLIITYPVAYFLARHVSRENQMIMLLLLLIPFWIST